jgi:hypothetical protein
LIYYNGENRFWQYPGPGTLLIIKVDLLYMIIINTNKWELLIGKRNLFPILKYDMLTS